MENTLLPLREVSVMLKAHSDTVLDAAHKLQIEPVVMRHCGERTIRYYDRDTILNALPKMNDIIKKRRAAAMEVKRNAARKAGALGRATMAEQRKQLAAAAVNEKQVEQPERVMRLMARLDRIEGKLDRLLTVWGITYG